jgi:carbon storage regulator CsrA
MIIGSLTLKRRVNQTFIIDGKIEVMVVNVSNTRATLRVVADRGISIVRGELQSDCVDRNEATKVEESEDEKNRF